MSENTQLDEEVQTDSEHADDSASTKKSLIKVISQKTGQLATIAALTNPSVPPVDALRFSLHTNKQ